MHWQGQSVCASLNTTSASMRVRMWTLVSTGAPHQCAYPGHVYAGISEDNPLDVLFSAYFVAIFKSPAVCTYLHGKFFHTDRKFDIRATQTSIHIGLTGQQPGRPEEAGKYTPVDKSIKRRIHKAHPGILGGQTRNKYVAMILDARKRCNFIIDQ